MAQDTLQHVQVSAVSQVADRERVAKRVERTAHVLNAKLGAQLFEISKNISLRESIALQRAKDPLEIVPAHVPVQNFTKFDAYGYESMFISLADDPQCEIIKLNILASEAQKLTDPKASINRRESKRAKTTLTDADGPPVQYSFDLLPSEGR